MNTDLSCPLYERELSDETTTARVTVDVAEGAPYGVLALEPSSGALRQMVMTLDPATCTALIDLLTGARDALEAMHQEAA